jgi:phage pi2 protein 07
VNANLEPMTKKIKGYLLNCELSRVDHLRSIDLFIGEQSLKGNVTPVTVIVGEADVEVDSEEIQELADEIYFTGSPQDFKDQQEFAKLYAKDQELKKNFLMCCSFMEKKGYGIVRKKKKEKVAP